LAVANVANFAIGCVIPGKGRADDGRDAHKRVRNSFNQLVAGNRGVVVERRRCSASGSATAAGLHVWHYAVQNMLPVNQAVCCAVVRAETTSLAAVASALRDRFSRRKKDHIKSVSVTRGIQKRSRKMSSVDLGQNL
jgi:hypothetical protein